MIPFEQENQRAYLLFLRIEVALRELLREAMQTEHGDQWQKKLHGELLQKIRKSQADENRPHFGFIRLGPLYYLTLGELLTQLGQRAGRTVVDRIGGDCVLKQIENLLAPRNALAHSRAVTQPALKSVEAVYLQIETALSPEAMKAILSDPDVGISQSDASKDLSISLSDALSALGTLPEIFVIPSSFDKAMRQYWWESDALAGFSRSTVECAINKIREYNSLPNGVGSAGLRQRFSDTHDLLNSIKLAQEELKKVAE